MELNIHAGMRVLYKKNGSNWLVGELSSGHAALNAEGLYLPVFDKEGMKQIHNPKFDWEGPDAVFVNINDVFLDAIPLDDWVKDYPQYYMTKEDYIKLTQEEDFDRQRENAYVTDGEYMYYPVSKFSKSWIEKQPFDYIVRSNL